MKASSPLPKSLQYLQPFVRSLAKLPPEELNEDIDASKLDSALRKRLRGLDETKAAQALSNDREELERWLKSSAPPDHPANWVFGYISLPDLAQHLTHPPEPAPVGPKIDFQPPEGWKVNVVPFRLDLKCGRLWASIAVFDPQMSTRLQQFDHWCARPPLEATLDTRPVTFGEVTGNKFTILQTAPVSWKSVTYHLTVPGGNVSVEIGERSGANFDETALEMQLHTVRIKPSP
jgi:hypothetical protein